MEILIPAYNYPAPGSTFWDRLIQASSKVRITAIVNPGSGPGTAQDANYVAVIDRLTKANIRVIGYVSTSWANRSMSEVKLDIDRWLNLYPAIQGLFFDEMTADSAASHIQFYAELRRYVNQRSQRPMYLVGNPGCCTTEDYCNVVDQIVLFEQHEGFQTFTAPHWISRIPNGFCVLRYASDEKDMYRTVQQSAKAGATSIYVTDRGAHGSNPWDELPSYWEKLLQAVQQPAPAQAQMVRRKKKKKCSIQ